MTLTKLLSLLQSKGMALSLAGENLSVRGIEDALSDHELIASLREHKKAIVALLKAGHPIGAGAPVPPSLIPDGAERITPDMLTLITLDQDAIDAIVARVPGGAANVADLYPLTPLQEGMLFHHLWSADVDAYTEGYLLAFPSRARVDRFVAALGAVVARHDILRTAIAWQGLPSPVQVVLRAAELPFEVVDIDPACDVAAELERRTGAHHRLDLSRAPLMRCHAAHDPRNDRWLLGVVFHHLAIDHTALALLIEETRAIEAGKLRELPPAVPFRNFVAQARYGVSQDEHDAFFARMLGDIDETTAPFGLLDARGDGSAISEASVRLPRPLATAIRKHARRIGVSPASVMHLAWGLVLARATGRADVVFGTVLFGRMQAGTETGRMLGLLMNTLPLRVSVGEVGVVEAVKRTHALLVELIRHEHAPLSLAQRASGVTAPAPLFTSLLNYRYNVEADPSAEASDVAILSGHERTNYPVTLSVDDLGVDFAFDAMVSARIGAERVCAFMQVALEQLVHALEHAPTAELRTLDVLPAAERAQVVTGWNAVVASVTADCVHARFAAQAARTPDAIAVVCDGAEISYGELNARANRLARHLQKLGVGPDARVAICVDRGIGMVEAVLGVLKAGGAYVPLDPAYASSRLGATLGDAQPVVLVVDGVGRKALGEHLAGVAQIVDVGDDVGDVRWADEPATDFDAGARSHHLAYIIYTSGSTGTPKGVMVEHAQVVRLFDATHAWFGFGADDVWSLFHSIGFDFSVWELWGALIYGGRLVVVPSATAKSPAELYRLVCREGVTVLNQTPSAFQQLVAAQTEDAHQLRTIVFGGEALELRTLAPWYARNGERTKLVNMYGITETTVHVTYRPLEARDAERPGPSPIGVKIPDLRLYVLDANRAPVPVGVTGELYVGGAGVARGYLHRPELTAERFIADPFTGEGRLYKTGDLGRWLPDGSIEYLGRNDFQVKIRGFRIELGEIEARLATAPGIRDVVVIAREDRPGDKRLVAYFTGAESVDARTLRDHASRGLPEYMIPAAYVHLDALPLTANGKLDRKALPAPESDAFGTGAYEAPDGPIESELAALWAELLTVERIGRRDSFFALGGHSLLAVRLVARIRKAFAVELALSTVFGRPELADMAAAITAATRAIQLAIPRADRTAALPLSLAQRRLWFLSQDARTSAAYHISGAARMRGALDVAVLRRAVARIVERHEALRTCFEVVAGEPVQVIRAAHDPVTEHTTDDLQGFLAAHTARPFDLARDLPLRVALVRIADDDHVLHLVLHHIAADGWSIGVLLHELSTLYRAFLAGAADPLPALAIQVADHAAWQARHLAGGALAAQTAFWRQALAGAPTLLELPADRARPAVIDPSGASLAIALGAARSQRIHALSQRLGVTPYVTLLASWAAALSRLTGQRDIVIGSPVAGRGRTELEPLIGFFVNTLALRIDLDRDPSVAELVARTRASVLAAQDHQDLPLDQVVEVVNPPRSRSHTPIFQVMFAWQAASDATLALPDLALSELAVAQPTVHCDLTLTLHDGAAGITGELNYATALFDRATVARVQSAWLGLLDAMLADTTAPVGALSILSAAERDQLLVAWNTMQPATPVAPGTLLHERFEAQAHQRPDAIALVHDDRTLTYGALNARANRLAHHLRTCGIGPDALVAICVDRGFDMLVALLATLKAGGAYVPLDPAYASERLASTLADARPAVVLVDALGRAALGDTLAGARTIDLARDAAAWADAPATDVATAELTAAHLAYVIYTSGSTGRPKGVMVEHAQVVRLFDATDPWFHFHAHDVWTLFHSFGFDFSVWEIWGALLYGGQLVIVPSAIARSPRDLVELVAARGVTVLNQTPSAFQHYMAAEAETAPRASRLRFVIFGGEALELRTLKAWYARHAYVPQLVNMYGITETTVHVTYRPLDAEDADRPGPSPIGVRIPDLQLHILDDRRQPVAIGVVGELYVGGAGVARGYLGKPALTAQRFLANPFPGGGRLYKTGDLARRLVDGSVEYLGRNDFQVKIRGFRIELGEIEATLARLAGVRDAVVIAREDTPGDKRLVGYYTSLAAGEAIDADVLRQHAAKHLPPYMVPSAFVHLDALPLTANGKLDRKALPAPDGEAFARRGYAAPIGEIEQTIAALWAELLKLERVGRHDHFFELGGHSLLAVQLASRLREALAIDVPLGAVFEHPELAALADHLFGAERSPLPAFATLDATQRHAPQPLSLAQQRLWFLTQLGSAGDAYHIGGAVRLRGALDRDVLRRALQRIVDRHAALRTTFRLVDGQPMQIVQPTAALPWQAHDAVDEAAALAACEAHERAPFDLAHQVPLRVMLVRIADDDHLLHVVFHHIAADGWSVNLLLGELAALYSAFLAGAGDPLPALAAQYADHAVWQRRWLADGALEAQAAFWRDALRGAPALLELPTDRARPAEQDHAGASVEIALDAALASQVRALCRRHGVTPYMALLASWAAVLGRLASQDQVVIGSPVAGRGRTEIEPLIGCFVNTLALRLDLAGATVGELITRTRATVLAAQAHQDLPFDQVVEAVKPPRNLSHTPVFQVMFDWQVASDGQLALPGLAVSSPAREATTARFDLSLTLADGTGGGMVGSLLYATSLFDRTTIDRFVTHWKTLLAAMVADDATALVDLPVLDAAQRHQVVVAWNATEAAYPRGLCLHQVFEQQVARTPDAIALTAGDRALTFAELNARANQLARELRARGVGPDVLVAVCVERSIETIVGFLGVMKAGGAYIPMDPDHPIGRLENVLEDAAPRVILTAPRWTARLPATTADVVQFDSIDAALDDSNLDVPGLSARNLAYVIFTSGSTGRPKGVMVEHRGIVNYAAHMIRQQDLANGDGSLVLTSFSFDLALTGLYPPLLCGKPVRLGTLGNDLDEWRRQILACDRLAPLKLTPSHLTLLQQVIPAEQLAGRVHTLVLGGEPLRGTQLRWWRDHAPEMKIFNNYGPTEISVACTAMEAGDPLPASVPLGRPISNARIYVLDAQRRPVPVGVVGEIYVGGVGVARGYVNRPELTAERFLPDPFAGDIDDPAGSRMYRTGDVARWRADGTVEYLGRNDHQVKIRGYRIELGEIETVLRAHPAVDEAIVVAREDAPGDTRLVAYVTGQAVSIDELRAHAVAQLPPYMVPSALVPLAAMPLNANGKIDRPALPAPDGAVTSSRAYEPPRAGQEEALARIWADLLKVERVGRHDNFFELGGHSLLAVSLIERMRVAALHVDVRAVFVAASLAELAERASATSRDIVVPPNRIPAGATQITPDMLTLVQLDQAAIDGIAADVAGGAANIADIYPLAPLQEGMLFHHLLDEAGDAYVESHLLSFASRAALDQFTAALDRVIARHDILRTGIAWRGLDQPVQVVRCTARLPIETVSFDPAAGAISDQLAAHCDPRRFRIDIGQAPLLRCHIARDEAADRWVMSVLSHHMVVDHTTLEVLVDEARAIMRGDEASLPPPPAFRTFVAQARLGVTADEHRAFFASMLGDIDEPTTPFGLVDVRGDGQRVREAHERLDLALSRAVRAHARKLGTSAASLLHLAWAMVLARTTGREQVVFGTVLFGRMHAGANADRGMGLFMNTLPIRIGITEAGVADSAKRTHATLIDLLHHEHAPLALAQRASRVPAEAPLFSSLLNYRYTVERDAPAEHGLEVLAAQERTNYPLVMSVDDLGDGFAITAHVREPIAAERVCAFMRTAVAQLVHALDTAPAAAARDVDVLPADERRQLLEAYNATGRAFDRAACLHDLFEAQVARTPDAIAVICGADQLTYRALDARANQLAHVLRARGVGPDALVGVAVERGVELVIAVLGVLKAGGAYIPLDPSYPSDRLALMLDDARPCQLVTQPEVAAQLPASDVAMVMLDDAAIAAQPVTPPARAGLTPRHLAYVIYTSGSTGKPKGVMVEHAQVVNFLASMTDAPGITAADVMMNVTSLSFDIAALELYLPLTCGARIVVARRDEATDPVALGGLLQRHGVTIMQATPSTWRMLAAEWPALDQPLTVLCGGEALPPSLLGELLAHVPAVWNLYGPTETTIWSTRARLTTPAAHIGQPIANTSIFLLDAALRPVPAGVAGELYIGGDGVARGYLHRPELTAERFVDTAHGRIYKTGDLARWQADGTLEYLGRNDFQVKLRGFRIELGEIEARLTEVDGVDQVIVMAREDAPGDKRLVAYYTARFPSGDDLRAHAARNLPPYMVPAAYVHLEAMPLTANGKVDRKALPAPEGEAFARRGHEAPRGEVEQLLAGLWSELLGTPEIGRHDNFFGLGGHSLLAVQLVSRLRKLLDLEVALATIFDAPTLSALAERIGGAARSSLEAIATVERGRPLPLSLAQNRLWILDRLADGHTAHNPRGAIRLRGALDRGALIWALRRIVRRHEALRTCFRVVDGEPMQVLIGEDRAVLVVEERDLRGHAEPDAAAHALSTEHADASFDLERELPLRAIVMRLADDEHVLQVAMHHIASDGWSMGVLLDELSQLYNAHRAGLPDPLPALAIQYADYAAWQRAWLATSELEHQIAFWRGNLAGAPTLLGLPTDRPRPAFKTHDGASLRVELDGALADQLEALGRRHGTTMYMTLLACWAITLGRLAGQDDVVIGSPVAGRNRAEIEPLIGFFINTLAMRVDLAGDPTVADLLARTRAQVLAAQRHQDLPFDQVIEAVQPPRSLSHTPIFQVTFAWQNAPAGALVLDGLALSSFEMAQETAQFDLTLALGKTDDGGIAGLLSYATALYDRATAERLSATFERVVRAVASGAADRQPVARLAILDAAERARVVTAWNASAAAYPADACAHELIEAQAARTPDAIALTDATGALTYGELNARANRLARQLRARGVIAEARVAICTDRSADMVVALLATLKAGGAYLPIDPALPRDRIAYMLDDAAPAAILVDAVGRAAIDLLAIGRPAIDVTEALAAAADESAANLAARELGIGPRSAAYVIYTSGSTGQPKGVVNEHRGLCNLITAQRAMFDVGPTSRVLQFAPFSFDASVWEVGMALGNGASLHVVPRTDVMPGPALTATLARHAITHVTLPPSALALCDDAAFAARVVIVAGEAISVREAQRWSSRVALFNAYGPTETTVCATAFCCPPSIGGHASVPIGRPIANARIYVLDRHGAPVPVGVTGELFIGGDGVARGYLHRPALTAERFVDDPFTGRAGDRMYKTGDLGRWLADGTIEFLGRNDHQVKLRGFRIELGEIETRLAERAEVKEVVVLAREDRAGDPRLVAYYTADHALSVAALREQLAACLPAYMVPSAFVHLTAFPLTRNGKVDRKALPAPEGAAAASRLYEAPKGEIEHQVAALWAELLDVERVGRHDSFFDLGGHSLLAVRMLARLASIVGAEVAPRELFAAPTLMELCAVATRRGDGGLPSNLTPFRRAGSKRPVFFLHPGLGEIGYVAALLPGIDPEVPVYGLSAIGYLPGEVPLDKVEDIAATYIAAIQRVQPHGPYRLVGWCAGGNIGHEMARQLIAAGERVEFLAFLDAPSTGPVDPTWLATLLNRMPDLIPDDLRAQLVALDRLGDRRGMIVASQAAGMLPSNLPLDTIERYLNVAYAIKVAKLAYVPPHIPVTLTHYLAVDRDPIWTMDGWESLTDQVHYVEVAGDHMSMVEAPHAHTLAGLISEAMERASA